MATASALENELTCSVCFDIYKNPHLLRVCLHTFCLECIHQLQQRGQIVCPECREVTSSKDVKKDFKVQRLLDIYNNEQSVEKKNISASSCGMCGQTKPLKSHCSECEHYMCINCDKIHKKMKFPKSHELKLVSEIAKECEASLKTLLADLEESKKNAVKTSKNISQNMKNIESARKNQILEIRKYTEEAMNKLKRNGTRLEKLVNDANDNLLQQLTLNLDICEQNKSNIDSTINFVAEMLKSTDITTLTETTNTLNESIKHEIQKIQAVLADKDRSADSPVTVNKGPNWDVTSCIQVMIKDIIMWSNKSSSSSQGSSSSIHGKEQVSHSDLHNCQYELEKKVQLNYLPFKTCIINNELWCAGVNAVYIYSIQRDFVKKITHDKIRSVLTLTHCHNTGHIILANRDPQGLHQLDSTGKYQSQIAEGSYSDTTYHDQLLYALEWKIGKVFVFKYISNTWSKIYEFGVNYKNGNYWDRLSVYDSGILISSYNNHCLYRHSIDGQFHGQYSRRGKGPRESKRPLVCQTDQTGRSVIADCDNYRVQIHDSEDGYQVVNIKGMEGRPVHVLVDHNGDLWITAHWPHFLMKFKKSSLLDKFMEC